MEHFIGLSSNAKDWLEKHGSKIWVISSEKRRNMRTGEITTESKDYDEFERIPKGSNFSYTRFGQCVEEIFLDLYILQDGTRAHEKVEVELTETGRRIFTALADTRGNFYKVTQWPEEEAMEATFQVDIDR